MKEIPNFTDETTLEEYLKEPLTKSMIREYQFLSTLDLANYNPTDEIVKKAEGILLEIYSYFNMLAHHLDDPGGILFNFEMNDSKLPFMELLVDYYELESTPILESMMESFYNHCDEYDSRIISSDYISNKLEKVQVRFRSIKKQEDSKAKLKELILFKQYLSGLYFRDTAQTTKEMLLKETEIMITNLMELESLGFLKSGSTKEPKTASNSPIRLTSKRKTDFIKLLSAMYDNRLFVDEEGKPLTNKQKMMEAFGEFLGDDFSKYSASLSQAKKCGDKTFLKPFKEIEKEALRYFEEVGE